MSKDDNGGPAFPCETLGADEVGEYRVPCEGMSLRDYFAAKAMQGLITTEYVTEGESLNARFNGLDHAAEISYRMADAMLKARNGKL